MPYTLGFLTTWKERISENLSGLWTGTELHEVQTQQSTEIIYLIILFS